MPSLYLLSREMGIKINKNKGDNKITRPGRVLPIRETWSGATIQRIIREIIDDDINHAKRMIKPKTKRRALEIERAIRKGYSGINPYQIHAVLGVILTSEQNQRMLYADMIEGVWFWVHANKIKESEVRYIKDAFYNIDLAAIREDVKFHGIRKRPPQIGIRIAVEMLPIMREIRNENFTDAVYSNRGV